MSGQALGSDRQEYEYEYVPEGVAYHKGGKGLGG